ncbi:MAG: hypothetical protein FWD16_05975, partial [Clostridia bacterium]|nr:hypothetical protein [Clostridia bacterium]
MGSFKDAYTRAVKNAGPSEKSLQQTLSAMQAAAGKKRLSPIWRTGLQYGALVVGALVIALAVGPVGRFVGILPRRTAQPPVVTATQTPLLSGSPSPVQTTVIKTARPSAPETMPLTTTGTVPPQNSPPPATTGAAPGASQTPAATSNVTVPPGASGSPATANQTDTPQSTPRPTQEPYNPLPPALNTPAPSANPTAPPPSVNPTDAPTAMPT